MTTKRGRGRPRGTGKNDTPYLTQAANFMVADPKLKPTTAMKRVIATREDWGESEETLLRRWQVKWKDAGSALLAVAKERANAKRDTAYFPAREHGEMAAFHGFEGLAAMTAAFDESPMMKAVREIENSPMMKIMRDFENSPMTKAMRAVENSPMMKTMREAQRVQDMIDPSSLRRVRDLLDPLYLRTPRGHF